MGKNDLSQQAVTETTVATKLTEDPPPHYSIKIKSYSLFSSTVQGSYKSAVFEAYGFKWRLVLYPKGNEAEGAADHVSMYLEMPSDKKLARNWKVDAGARFFVQNHKKKKYMVFQDKQGKMWHFTENQQTFGFTKLLDLSTFETEYLHGEDTCSFGVEIFMRTKKEETISMRPKPSEEILSREISNFLSKSSVRTSKPVKFGRTTWTLLIYPKGKGQSRGTSLSVDIRLENAAELEPGRRVYGEFRVVLRDQSSKNRQDLCKTVAHWFRSGTDSQGKALDSHGLPDFISLRELKNSTNGFLKDGTLKVEARCKVISITE